MRAIVYEGPGLVACKEVPMVEPRQGWTLLRVAYAGVCGSDMTIYSGKHPRAKAPLVLGHEFSGYVASFHPQYEEGTLVTVFPYLPCRKCERCSAGQYHVCKSLKLIGIDLDGGMADYVLVPQETLVPVPEGLAPLLGAFIEPIGISVHVARKGGYVPGASALVFGAGAIGLSTAITLRAFGAQQVIISEPMEARRALARSMGFDVLEAGSDIVSQVDERTDGNGAQFVFDCAGAQPVVDLLPDVVRINGSIIIVAGYKQAPAMNFQKGMFREFDIRFVRNCTWEDFAIAARLAGKGLGYDRLLNYAIPLEQVEQGFHPSGDVYKVMFKAGGA